MGTKPVTLLLPTPLRDAVAFDGGSLGHHGLPNSLATKERDGIVHNLHVRSVVLEVDARHSGAADDIVLDPGTRTVTTVALAVAREQDSVFAHTSDPVTGDERLARTLNGYAIAKPIRDGIVINLGTANDDLDANAIFLMNAIGIVNNIATHCGIIAVRNRETHALSVRSDKPGEVIVLDDWSHEPGTIWWVRSKDLDAHFRHALAGIVDNAQPVSTGKRDGVRCNEDSVALGDIREGVVCNGHVLDSGQCNPAGNISEHVPCETGVDNTP